MLEPSLELIMLSSDERRRLLREVSARLPTNSALTIRLGCPATMTVKSLAARPRIGCPCRSTTPTSTVTSSTPDRNVGVWPGCACGAFGDGGCCACGCGACCGCGGDSGCCADSIVAAEIARVMDTDQPDFE